MTNLDKQRDELAAEYVENYLKEWMLDRPIFGNGQTLQIKSDRFPAFNAGFSACEKILSERIEKLEAALKMAIRRIENMCEEAKQHHERNPNLSPKPGWAIAEMELDAIKKLRSGEHE